MELNQMEMMNKIAVIGISGRFPQAKNIKEFWDNLTSGVEAIKFYTDEELLKCGVPESLLKDTNYVKACPVLEDSDMFDNSFFGINPREAELMDPQHRLFLQHSWEVLESSGYNPENYDGRIGVFGGASVNSYLINNILTNSYLFKEQHVLQNLILHGNTNDYLSTRVAYKLNLKGPAMTIQTACSTSLVAVHMACQSLLNYQSDMAIAGGVSVRVPIEEGYLYQEGGIFSPDGHCRAFDEKGKGTIFGSGVGVVLLKRLEDAIEDRDNILAVILGSAINNDGSNKVGYTAPSVEGQAEVIAEAIEMSGISSNTIGYIEAHGTGTALGDPIEIEALTKAFGKENVEKCPIGSVKTNIGHLNAASGIAGFIKSVLVVKEGVIPPSLNYEKPNPSIDFENSPFYVNTKLSEWKTDKYPRRAGVSSFGIGGTNAHVVLEEYSAKKIKGEERDINLICLSAKTQSALKNMCSNLENYLGENRTKNLSDIAYTLQIGRKDFEKRYSFVCKSIDDAIIKLRDASSGQVEFSSIYENSNKAFMFPGQGSQYINMALELYRKEPLFKKYVDKCSEILLKHLGFDIRDVIYPKTDEKTDLLNETFVTQPALFVIEYSLAMFLIELGISPDGMIGHSIGEYVAACIAGVLSLEDALMLISYRGRIIQSLPGGDMISVGLSSENVAEYLNEKVSLAAINGPSLCVLSGCKEEIKQLEDAFAEKGVFCKRLYTSHAFHSHMLDPILEDFKAKVNTIKLNKPTIKYISNVTGTWIKPDEAMSAEYWTNHLRHAVMFDDGIKKVIDEFDVLVELGPGKTLSTLLKQYNVKSKTVINLVRHPKENKDDSEFIMEGLSKMWDVGVSVDWKKFYKNQIRYRVSLPTYPFEPKRFWFGGNVSKEICKASGIKTNDVTYLNLDESEEQIEEIKKASFSTHQRPNLSCEYCAPRDEIESMVAQMWEDMLGVSDIGIYDNFFELGGHSLLATQIISRIQDSLQVTIPIKTIFEEPTIEKLSALITKQLIDKIDSMDEESLYDLAKGEVLE